MQIVAIMLLFAVIQFGCSTLTAYFARRGMQYWDLSSLMLPIGMAAFLCTRHFGRRIGAHPSLWALLPSYLTGMTIGAAGSLLMSADRKGIPVGSSEFIMSQAVSIVRLVISILAMLLAAGAAITDWNKIYRMMNKWN